MLSAHSTDPAPDMRLAQAQWQEARFFADMLEFSRLVLLFGEAGAGKTTLLRDGVIPALRAESAPGDTRHVVYFDTWNDAPLVALDACTEGTLPPALFASADTPRLRYGPWVERLGAWTKGGQRLIFVFDHFERYLESVANAPELDPFARQWIAALADPALPVQFLVAMRTAAEPALVQRFGAQIAGLGDNRVVLPPRQRPTHSVASPDVDETATTTATRAPVSIGASEPAVGSPAPASPNAKTFVEPVAVLGLDQLATGARSTVAADPAASAPAARPPRAPTAAPPRPAARSERKPVAAPPASASRQARTPLSGIQSGARTEPWFDPVAAAPRATAPQPRPAAPSPTAGVSPGSNKAARAPEDRVFEEDDLFGPEPDTPPPSRVQAWRARRRAVRGAMLLLGIVTAVVVSAALFVPPNDQRIPLRARAAATGAQGVATLPAQPGAAQPAAPPPQAGATAKPLPPLERAAPVTSPLDTATVNAKGGPPRPPARPASPGPTALGLPAETMPPAGSTGPEPDAATAMARDVGGALAAEGRGALAVRAGIGATAATGARGRPDLFIARYDVLDAMRTADSGDSRNIDGLRLLVPLQVEPIYVAVRHDDPIEYVHEIANRRINLGAGGTDAALGSAHLYERLFDTPIGAQRASYMPDAEALTALVREHSVDVVVLVGRAGFTALAAQQRATPGAFKLLTFDPASVAGRRALRSYLSVELSPSPGTPWLAHRLPALAVMSFLVGRGVDEERTGRIVRTLCQERGRLRSTGHPYWLSVGFNPVNAPGWRYAAGAERELRACSSRWSARTDAPNPAEPSRRLVSQLNVVSAADR